MFDLLGDFLGFFDEIGLKYDICND